jgi:ketosteroid isomerase-like protein
MEREAMVMAGEMTAVLQGMFDALDKSDPEVALASIAADAQGIDEISRRWMRGPGEVSRYVRELFGIAEDVHSEMHDVREVDWGETGIVTFWLEQDYSLDGDRAHVSAPTTAVMRREHGAWKLALFHSLPLPPDP